MPGVDVGELVQVHRRGLLELMQRFTRLKEDAPDDDLSVALVADAEIYRLDATIRWLDSVDARLARLPDGRRRQRLRRAAPARTGVARTLGARR